MILGYLSGPSPHITSAAISALSVLVFKEPDLCLLVSDIVPSVTSLPQTKAVEVIQNRHGKTTTEEADSADAKPQLSNTNNKGAFVTTAAVREGHHFQFGTKIHAFAQFKFKAPLGFITCNLRFLNQPKMFTNDRRQAERTGKYGTPRLQHLQDLVTEFQTTNSEQQKEKIAANLANFAYDPYNYAYLRQLNVLELFLDCLTEPNERLIEFGAGGICNAVADPENAKVVAECGGVAALIGCLSSPVKNTVKYAIGGLYYLCESGRVCDRREVLKEEVVELIGKYAESGGGGGGFGNLARALLDNLRQKAA